ncbi:hypothetical protein VTL71DRAFT_10313 [Oculimacula yallundae]|uniref:Amidase domain-containing protein n=1 Tax=Oculimacula yallundae TaxID=86028 RepID=A0ABR4CSX2_9HELO
MVSYGGQCQSAYAQGGVLLNDSKDGHSSPAGSSSRPAVTISAGYAPHCVGTDTDGSPMDPAGRASVYTIKPSIGVVSQDGLIPVSRTMDFAGPMGKTPYDIAALLELLREDDAPEFPADGYTSMLDGIMAEFLAAVDYRDWICSPKYMASEESATVEMYVMAWNIKRYRADTKAREFFGNVPLPKPESANLSGEDCPAMIKLAGFRHDLPACLDALECARAKNIQALINFNIDIKNISSSCEKSVENKGIDYIPHNYNADVITGPPDSALSTLADGSGYPIAGMPLVNLDINGRGFGMVALPGKHQGATLLRFLCACDSGFHPPRPLPMLVGETAELDANYSMDSECSSSKDGS